MTPAGLLVLVLGLPYAAAPSAARPDLAEEVRRQAESLQPAPVRSAPEQLPASVEFPEGTRVDVAGHAVVCDAADVPPIAVVLAGQLVAPVAPPFRTGFVYPPAYSIDPDLCTPPATYVPQPGDIVLVVSDHLIWELMFAIALLHEPYHIGIVVQMPNGTFGMLEAGPPELSSHVRISPLAERLATDPGRVFIRRRNVPLTPEQSAALTGFALRQDGKPYAYIRLLAQGTPFRSRGPIRTKFMGKSRGEPCSYFCSELAIEALVSAGLIDPVTARPRATAPEDVFYDQSKNPWLNTYLKLYPWWDPPQRWVPGDGPCGN